MKKTVEFFHSTKILLFSWWRNFFCQHSFVVRILNCVYHQHCCVESHYKTVTLFILNSISSLNSWVYRFLFFCGKFHSIFYFSFHFHRSNVIKMCHLILQEFFASPTIIKDRKIIKWMPQIYSCTIIPLTIFERVLIAEYFVAAASNLMLKAHKFYSNSSR